MAYESKNPAFRSGVFTQARPGEGVMTVTGTIQKTVLLLGITVAAAVFGWMMAPAIQMPAAIGCGIGGLILGLIIGFKPTTAPYLSPVYAVLKGVLVGAISSWLTITSAQTKNIWLVPTAAALTFGVFGVMLALYGFRIIRVNDTLRGVIVGATLAVFIAYAATLLLGLTVWKDAFNLPIYQGGPIGIGFSLLVIGIAAFNFLLDFDNIEDGVNQQAPKYMEWYGAWGLLVTLVWLYIEILRLLRKLQR